MRKPNHPEGLLQSRQDSWYTGAERRGGAQSPYPHFRNREVTMADDIQNRSYRCIPSAPGLRTLIFPDGCRACVTGLNEILEAVHSEGMKPCKETAEEITDRLEKQNYIAPSARKEYRDLLLKEYEKYLKNRENDPR